VGFRATYHDTILGLVHDAHVVVGMLLLMGMQPAISLTSVCATAMARS
jgi:hypothetical protein